MAKAGPDGLITALDIGSSKVSAMIAQKGDGGELIVLGTGQRESRGVKRGYIADMAATEAAVREAVEQAERIAGTNIEDVWVGFSAGGLVSDVAEVEFELGGHRVEQADIDALLSAGRNSIDPQGRMVLHAQPALYTLDGLTGRQETPGAPCRSAWRPHPRRRRRWIARPQPRSVRPVGASRGQIDHRIARRDGACLSQ